MEVEVTRLLQGEENALSRLIDELYALGVTARRSAALVNLLASPPPDPIGRLASLEADLPDAEQSVVSAFRAQFTDFLSAYGDRTGKGFGSENTLLMPTWREDPSVPLRLAAAYLNPAIGAPAAARQRARQA